MRRREFITLLGSAVATWPLSARAQQPAVPVIGYLIGGSSADRLPVLEAFRKALKETGFIEDANLRIEYRFADFQFDRLPALAADLVRRSVAVIMTSGSVNTTLAAMAATRTIPIVFSLGSDPVQIGLVASLNRPGGNVTGVTTIGRQLKAKELELLRDLVPNARVIGFVVNPANPNAPSEVAELQALAQAGGWRLQVVSAGSETELDAAFATLAEQKAAVFLTSVDSIFNDRKGQIAVLAARYAIPGVSDPHVGGLMSYGASQVEAHHQAGIYVGRILKGAKPADLPVVQPTKFQMVINLKTAKALGLTVPPNLLATADEVIE
jgi:putative ABC transport system substrate-binding protein